MRAWEVQQNVIRSFSKRFPGTYQRCPRGAQGALHHGIGCLASLTAEKDVWIITLLLRPQRHCLIAARRRHLPTIVHEGDYAAPRASGDPSFVDGHHT